MLRDDHWARIEHLLPGKASDRGVTAKDNRRFLEAVLWVMRTEIPWRDLPAEYGHWHRTYVRFSRWREKGVFERVAQAFVCDADTERLFLDSTIVRAHQHSSGAQKKAGGQEIGHSFGRSDRRYRVRRQDYRTLAGTGRHCRQGLRCGPLCRHDRGSGAQAVIPLRSNRLTPRNFDHHLYRDRNLVERFFVRIKHFRRIATRYDKLSTSFLSFIHLACAYVRLA